MLLFAAGKGLVASGENACSLGVAGFCEPRGGRIAAPSLRLYSSRGAGFGGQPGGLSNGQQAAF